MRRFVLSVMLLAVATGCGDPLSPAAGDMFVLVAVGNEPPPASTRTDLTEIVIADTLVFLIASPRGGRVSHAGTFEHFSGNQIRMAFEEDYRLDRGVITFLIPPCPINALCGQVRRQGQLQGDDLVVVFAHPSFQPLTYRRVR